MPIGNRTAMRMLKPEAETRGQED
uniref:Uncharacterized protein n=1 Tax=Ipomoea trifida TaxID=35884 RepID=A0A8Y6_IPOTF|nr:hypothetical protein [Ipomoea trifida]